MGYGRSREIMLLTTIVVGLSALAFSVNPSLHSGANRGNNGAGNSRRLVLPHLVFPHVPEKIAEAYLLEKSGTINNLSSDWQIDNGDSLTSNPAGRITFDTTIFMTYTPGLSAIPHGPGATVDLYLFNNTDGAPLHSRNGAAVCNPCTFPLGQARNKIGISLREQIAAAGGLPPSILSGYGVLVLRGDHGNVGVQGVTVKSSSPDGANAVNGQTGASDLSVFGFEPQPLAAEAQ